MPDDQKSFFIQAISAKSRGWRTLSRRAQQLSEHPWMFVIVGQGGGSASGEDGQ
ncbi:hypothetical protein ACVXG8_25770 [Escherichia coli]